VSGGWLGSAFASCVTLGPPDLHGSVGVGMSAPKVAVGYVNYKSYPDLEASLESVRGQSLPPVSIHVVDFESDPIRCGTLGRKFPEVVWLPGPNRGYGAGGNAILDALLKAEVGAEFLLLLNPDVILDPDYLEKLLNSISRVPQVAFAGGKLLRPGRERIDSAGVLLPRNRRPFDRGKGERDCGQFESEQLLFGVSGAAFMIRIAAVAELTIAGQLFDEDFFLYHEETDLTWRAKLFGWDCLYVPRAVAVHGRRWREDGRFAMPASVRRHSFKNHYLEMIKNERPCDVLRDAPILLFWELLRFVYALFRDPAMLRAYPMAFQLMGTMWERRKQIQRRIAAQERPPIDPWR